MGPLFLSDKLRGHREVHSRKPKVTDLLLSLRNGRDASVPAVHHPGIQGRHKVSISFDVSRAVKIRFRRPSELERERVRVDRDTRRGPCAFVRRSSRLTHLLAGGGEWGAG